MTSYEEWLASAEATVEDLSGSHNIEVVKTLLTVDELRRWQRDARSPEKFVASSR